MSAMTKKNFKGASKKVNKHLDQLLKEKRNLDDTAIMNKVEVLKKMNESSASSKSSVPKKNSKKKEAIVVTERKPSSKKKEALVVEERKNAKSSSNNRSKSIKKVSNKRKVLVSRSTKETIQKNSKNKKVSEDTFRFHKFEDEMRSLYDKVEDVVQNIETDNISENINLDNILVTESNVSPHSEEIVNVSTTSLSSKIFMGIFTFLFIVFTLLFIVFLAFIFYVCTY